MKLRADICIEIDADDFVAAADHQRRIEQIQDHVRAVYPTATLVFREFKRRARARSTLPASKVKYLAGRPNPYVD